MRRNRAKLTKYGLKSCFPQIPRKDAICRKIIDRRLGEQQLIEMAAFHSWLRFTLTLFPFFENTIHNWQNETLTFQHSYDKIRILKSQHLWKREVTMQERFETFTVLINRISRDIRRIKNQEMAAYHLRSVHVSCLYYIYSLNGVTSAELCEHCEEDKATISRALEYLESNGFIVRNSEWAKRYRSPLRLTEKGQEASKRIAEKISAVLATVSRTLTEDERAAFYRSLSAISRSLEAIAQNSEE